jgi:hypothetical protein
MAAVALLVVERGLQLFGRLDESLDDLMKMVQAPKSLIVILDPAMSPYCCRCARTIVRCRKGNSRR